MFKTIKYISALSVVGFSLAACSDDITNKSDEYTISGTGEKSPLEIAVSLKDGYNRPSTRAVDTKFKTGDVLIAYVQQVKGTLSSGNPPVFTPDETSPVVISTKVEFTVKDADSGVEIVTSDYHSTNIYWDDFSSTTDDIRDANRYLRVGYGYCYNGRTDGYSVSADGSTVTWTVDTDQKTKGIKTSDLLWAGAQEVRHYNHDSFKPDASATDKQAVILPVVYEHAMSKVTLELVLADGYENITTDQINAIAPKLFANKTAEYNAVAKTVTPTVEASHGVEISMSSVGSKTESNKTYYIYEALIAPTAMVDGKKLAEVTVAGNKYELSLTTAMLGSTDVGNTIAWVTQLESDGTSRPGVNYHLVATLKKQRIEVEAMILPWNDVYASTTGKISFNADVKESDVKDATNLLTLGSFDLWRATANNAETDYDYVTSTSDKIDKASTYEYNTTTQKWEATSGNDVLYWDNATTSYYFRALAKVTSTDSDGKVTIASVDGSTAVLQSTDPAVPTVDLLWAQTSEHEAIDANGDYFIDDKDPSKNKLYGAGDAINPRTGDVPLTFEHAMSKISVVLQTSDVETEKVDLTDATISIINLYNGGTIGVHDGLVTKLTAPDPENGEDPMTVKGIAHTEMKNFLVVPQSLVYLKDGTTERSITPIFYSADELTAIYPNANSEYAGSQNTSIGTGTPSYYLTRELTAVPAVYYADIDEDKAIIYAFNKTLDGHKVKDDIEIPEILQVNYDYDGFITDQHHKTFTTEQFTALQNNNPNAIVKIKHQDATYYKTLEDFHTYINDETKYLALPAVFRAKSYYQNVEDYNAGHSSELTAEEFADLTTEQKIKDYYTYAEFSSTAGDVYTLFTTRLNDDSILPKAKKQKTPEVQQVLYTYDEYINLDKIEQDMFDALPADLKIKTPHADEVLYTEETANAYNLTLPGAKHVGDIKIPAHYALPSEGTLTPHNAGDLSVVGNKIMMYIFLADGTRYSAELCTCLDTTGTAETNPNYGKPVTQWKRNEHYTYTITLTKEKIFFRALVKGWEEKKVGGNATLDWD